MLSRLTAKTIAVLFVLGMAAQAQADLLTYQQVVKADNPNYYWTWEEATGAALNNGVQGIGGTLGAGSAAVRAASWHNNGGLSLGTCASFSGTANQVWSTQVAGGSLESDSANYSNYAIEFWAKLSSGAQQYLSNNNNTPAIIYNYSADTLALYTLQGQAGITVATGSWNHFVVADYIDPITHVCTQTIIVNGNYAGRFTATGISYSATFPVNSMYQAVNGPLTIGGADPTGGLLTAGSAVDEYAVYNLSSLDQTAYDAKLQNLAAHYGATGVPEPGTFALLAAGLAGLLAYAWKKRK